MTRKPENILIPPRLAEAMTPSEMGRKGGRAYAAKLKAGEVPHTGGLKAKPTKCPRCHRMQLSARAAWRHCRTPRDPKE